jgi:hypothetical protein
MRWQVSRHHGISDAVMPRTQLTASRLALAACHGEHGDAGDEDPIYTEEEEEERVASPSSRPRYVGTALLAEILKSPFTVPLENLARKALAFAFTPWTTPHRQQPQCSGLVARHQ